MKPLRGTVWGCALVLLALSAAPADAAWCNVFQVCWHRQRLAPAPAPAVSYYVAPAPAVSYYAAPAPCCNPCPPPPPVCTTSYVQRCYYQPVTTYQSKTYYEPVTTYRTSYYYEPVTSYRYSSYYDPCTCTCQQVATPTTCYQLRSQCCPVQSWVQRCCSVPVTTYQQSFYWEPVTSCCTPTPAVAAVPAPDCAIPPAPIPGTVPPGVSEPRPSGPGVTESPSRAPGTGFQSYQGGPAAGSSLRLLPPRTDAPAVQPAPPPPGNVKLDRIASNSTNEVQGKVLGGDHFPLSGARLLFVNADRREPRRLADTDANGQFNVKLASGGWLVYIHSADGQPVFQRKIEVSESEKTPLSLVSR